MCGAFSILHPFRSVGVHFNAGYNEELEKPRYNVRPTQKVPIVIEEDGENELVFAEWGITPVWMDGKLLFNTRDESVATKPYFERVFKNHRCLVPADGFYEWKNQGGKKLPVRFELKTKDIFGFAGIYEKNKETGQLQFSIITTTPNSLVEKVHNRMPVIIPREKEQEYISQNSDSAKLIHLLKPFPASHMQSHPVSTLVNSAKNDSAEILNPV